MARITTTKRIEASQGAVFQVFADLDRAADHIRGITSIEKLTEGPVAKGTRFRETRVMFKREATEELEFTHFDPPQSYTIGCDSCGCTYRTTFHFVPNGNVTDVEVEMEARPVTLLAKLTAPVMNLLMGKAMQKAFEQDLEDLKRAAESGGAVPAVAAGC